MTSPSLIHYHPSTQDKADTLKVIDALRAAVESGECVAFACVAIAPDDAVSFYGGQTMHVSRLRTMGAIAHLGACMHAGEI